MDKKLKIAIIGSRGYPYIYSGYETLVKELSERLIIKGYSVRVYCHSSLFSKKPKFVNGIELVYTPSIETKFLSQIINSFFSFIHVCLSNIDVILVLNSANGPFGILTKIFRKKTCINVDGLEWLRPKWKGLGSLYFKAASKLSTIMFDQIITDSDHMRNIYLKKFNTDSTVIAYGSTMDKSNEDNFLKKFSLNKKQFYLIVGRLIPDNNSYLIIKGFINSGSKKKLVIVGDVPYTDSYSKSVKLLQNEKIILTGYINSQAVLAQLYNNCLAYFHGHEFGGTNPTMINAIKLNCNIIALETFFSKEMLKNVPSYFFTKKVNSISEIIKRFENEHSTKKELKYRLSNKYCWDKITNQYIHLFKKL